MATQTSGLRDLECDAFNMSGFLNRVTSIMVPLRLQYSWRKTKDEETSCGMLHEDFYNQEFFKDYRL
jgi:hypothetical protein